jgi:hypothetical protein
MITQSTTSNRNLLGLAVIITLVQFIIFKLLYPFPDFFSDSYSYIRAASAHLDISIWPIGYSKFLAAFHAITHSDTALIAFQYFFLEIAAMYFFFTILYLYQPRKIARNLLFAFLFCNPLVLYLSNYVNSDPLFAALSLLWITQILWIVHKPRTYQLFTQAVLLFACFTVRNNAYYYPLVSVLAFAVSSQTIYRKVFGMALGLALIVPFILFERNAAYKITGTHQFSLFTGWQLANNALYIYDQIKVDSTQLPSDASRELDRISREYVSTIPAKLDYRSYLQYYVGNYFIRMPQAPLKHYLNAHYTINGDSNQVEAWGKASVVFSEYGSWILKHYPVAYLRYFMIPNARNYFLAPLEKLELYNLGLDDVPIVVQDWFDYKTPDIWSVSKTAQKYILFIFPPLFLLLNLVFFCSAIAMLVKRKFKSTTGFVNRTVIISSLFMLANFGFSVVATINVFRYQFIPMILCLTYSLILVEVLDKKIAVPKIPLATGKKNDFEIKMAKI